MEMIDPRAALQAAAMAQGESLAALSRLLGRNAAYLQQFVQRGTPRRLAEQDRRLLAGYLGLSDAALGGPDQAVPMPVMARVPRLDVGASAGPGGVVDSERTLHAEGVDAAMLRRLGLRADALSIVVARGDSMWPTIGDGDEMLVDHADTAVDRRGGVYAIRIDGAVMVKRLLREGRALRVISDNPVYPAITTAAVDIIGRVVRLSRLLK